MKKLLFLTIVAITFGLTIHAQSSDVTKLKVNNSTIYRVEAQAIWTTTLNQLQVITRFAVTSTTEIYLNNKPAGLKDLRPGFKVTIYYYENPLCTSVNGCNVAVRILAYSGITPI